MLELLPSTAPWVGVAAFEEAGAIARCWQDPIISEEALALYGGDLLPDDLYDDWTRGRRERLRMLYVDLLTALAGAV